MVSVAELMTDPDFARRFTVRRAKSVTYANEGEATISYGEDSVIGVVQHQETTTDLTAEGTRTTEIVKVWCAEELRAADAKNIEPDVLVIDRDFFKVTKCVPWPDNGYWQVTAESFIP
jgi:hypothetical protein